MKNVKLALLVCGVAGLASCFIGDLSLWKMHEAPGFMAPVLLAVIGFAAAAAMAGMSLNKSMEKWQAIVALVGSIASLWIWQKAEVIGEIFKLKPLYDHPSLGSILFSLGFYGGAVTSIILLVKGDDKAA